MENIKVVARDLYRSYDHAFHYLYPEWLRQHRSYFEGERGFGENAFHAAWLDVLRRHKPQNLLEIGVYRGQSLSLWQLIASKFEMEMFVAGISPLTNLGDSVSVYPEVDYESDIFANFNKFSLKTPLLVKSLSTESLSTEFISSKNWDLIYIDGSHEYDVVLHDYEISLKNLKVGGILCMDDSSLFWDTPIEGVFKGHFGPSKVAMDFATVEMNYEFTVGHLNFFSKK